MVVVGRENRRNDVDVQRGDGVCVVVAARRGTAAELLLLLL